MKRRRFLQFLGLGSAAAVVGANVLPAVASKSDVIGYGRSVPTTAGGTLSKVHSGSIATASEACVGTTNHVFVTPAKIRELINNRNLSLDEFASMFGTPNEVISPDQAGFKITLNKDSDHVLE